MTEDPASSGTTAAGSLLPLISYLQMFRCQIIDDYPYEKASGFILCFFCSLTFSQMPTNLEEALNSSSRPVADQERDQNRNPTAVLNFLELNRAIPFWMLLRWADGICMGKGIHAQ